jgi:protein DGCR14
MTVGSLGATPRVIDPIGGIDADGPNTPFHIPNPTPRESLAHKLSNQASKSLRSKAALLTGTPRSSGHMGPPRTPARREGLLTPAARRLLDRTTLGTAASRRAEAMDREAGWEVQASIKSRDITRVRWTPTPSPVAKR